jgi:hypothetical protein
MPSQRTDTRIAKDERAFLRTTRELKHFVRSKGKRLSRKTQAQLRRMFAGAA